MTIDERRAWRALLDDERRLRKQAVLAKPLGNTEAIREWWSIVERALAQFVANPSIDPPPTDLLAVLSRLAGYLAVGKVPEPIADVATQGNTSLGPSEKRDIRMAVT